MKKKKPKVKEGSPPKNTCPICGEEFLRVIDSRLGSKTYVHEEGIPGVSSGFALGKACIIPVGVQVQRSEKMTNRDLQKLLSKCSPDKFVRIAVDFRSDFANIVEEAEGGITISN